MIIALAVLAAAVLVGVGVVSADRACAALVERKAAAAVSASFGHPATVQVHGTPFLTQAVRGRYADVEVLGTLGVGEIAGAALIGHLRNVRLPVRDLVARKVRELPCEHVWGQVVLPYAGLARAARIPGLTLRFDGERLLAGAALPILELPGLAAMVPGIGQLARVEGEAVLSLRGPNEVWLAVRQVSIAGVTLPTFVLNQLVPSLAGPIPLPGLPFGLRLDELRPTDEGLVVHGSADAVLLRAGDQAARDPRPTRQDDRPTD